jgi:G6PDH family F420-dependent oxidoreductase
MARFGYKLMSEEHGPRDLVKNAVRAEEVGFDLLAISDHYAPWIRDQGHAPFAWSVLGAIANATERAELMTAVTCPFMRYHPAVVAQAAATLAVLSQERFTLGLGSGELLNEHVVGDLWPRVAVRHEMLAESIDIVRMLFGGGEQSYSGIHLELANAELYDLPKRPPRIVLAAGGPEAATLAAEKADGPVGVEPDEKLVGAYRKAGGKGRTYAECGLCWAPNEKKALETLHRYHRWGVLGWSVLAELPRPQSFEEATEKIEPADLRESIPCGPDPDAYLRRIDEFLDAGFDSVILMQVGPDQDGFFKFFEKELASELRARAEREPAGSRR